MFHTLLRKTPSMMMQRTPMQMYQFRSFAAFVKAVQKPLPYPINGLEPVISQRLMEFHYGKHHLTYVNNLNNLQQSAADALESGDTQKYTDLSQAVKFNGGGHLNHEFFWDSLSPVSERGGVLPAEGSDLHNALTHSFGSVEDFIKHFSANTAAV